MMRRLRLRKNRVEYDYLHTSLAFQLAMLCHAAMIRYICLWYYLGENRDPNSPPHAGDDGFSGARYIDLNKYCNLRRSLASYLDIFVSTGYQECIAWH